MKQYFIYNKENHPCLTLFFAGWGMDEHPFIDYRPIGSDLLVCYDYRSLDFDFSLLEGYREIRVVAWSMGVWAASCLLQGKGNLPVSDRIAVNGTLTPVDDEEGIPPLIFKGTLDGLNERSLQKFYRRMCGSGEATKHFLERAPQRNIEDLREELRLIGERAVANPVPSFTWKIAAIGTDDLIFGAANQHRAWTQAGVMQDERQASHYDEALLREWIERK